MKHAVLLFPHQLYKQHEALAIDGLHIVIEHPLYFGTDKQYPIRFHKQKLVLHRASMKWYFDNVIKKTTKEHIYIPFERVTLEIDIVSFLKQKAITDIHVIDPTDYVLERRIRIMCRQHAIVLHWYESPNFLTPMKDMNAFFDTHKHKKKHYSMAQFYTWQRKRLNILLTSDGSPTGGKWSYDTENRKKLPADSTIPTLPAIAESEYVQEAKTYVQTHFSTNPGNLDTFAYPITHADAEMWLETFLNERFEYFGPYEDAMTKQNGFLFHSILTPILNIGLLDPQYIISRALQFAENNSQTISLPSLEGFVRQIIGWREFMRATYVRESVTLRNGLFFSKNTRTLSENWYKGTTGLVPVDTVIKRIQNIGYAHHIERLMILGNSMLLCEIHPQQVYRWFMELFVDAYDWVMVPNVYGMSQFAAGPIMTTKPYVSSSRYIRSMSDYPAGDWTEIWDGLYWRFVNLHADYLRSNARMFFAVSQLKKMDIERKKRIMQKANECIEMNTSS